MPRMAIRRYPWSPIFYGPLQTPLTRLLSSVEGIWCQDRNTLLSVSCTLTERKRSFYVVAEAGLKMLGSSCLLATDFKRRSPRVTEVFGLFIRLSVRVERLWRSLLIQISGWILSEIFPKTSARNCAGEMLNASQSLFWQDLILFKGSLEILRNISPTYSWWHQAIWRVRVLFGEIFWSLLMLAVVSAARRFQWKHMTLRFYPV